MGASAERILLSSTVGASSTIKGDNMNLLWTILVILLVLWALGFSIGFAGPLVHILLVVALIVVIVNLVTKGRIE